MARRSSRAGVIAVIGIAFVAALLVWRLWPDDATSTSSSRDHRAAAAGAEEPAAPPVRRVREATSPDAPKPPDAAPASEPKAGEPAEPTFPLEVTVLRGDGTPAAGAQVLFMDPNDDGNPSASATADAKGVASLRAPAGLARVVAWLGAEGNANEPLVDPAETHAATIRLAPAVGIHGRVVQGGRPVGLARVTVTIGPWLTSEFGLSLSADTDADGRFATVPISTAGMDAASSLQIAAATADLASGESGAEVAAVLRGDDIVIELVPPFTVRARFVDAAGDPIRDVIVSCASQKQHATSGTDGRIALRLPRCMAQLVARHPTQHVIIHGYANGEPYRAIVWVARPLGSVDGTAGDVDLGDVVFAQGRRLAGQVVDSGNRPARHASVRLWLDGIEVSCTATDDDGRFVFPEVGPDAHRIGVRECLLDDSPTNQREAIVGGVHGGDPDLRIVLEDAFAVRLQFLSAEDRKPIACAQFNARRKLHGEGFEWLPFQSAGDPAEEFDLEVFGAGAYDVEVDVPGYEPLRFESVEVRANFPTPLELLLRKKHE